MDPVANLKRQRELAAEIIQLDETELPDGSPAAESRDEQVYQLACELAELVQALDEWRKSGGFDPYTTNDRVRDAIRGVVAYNWQDEQRDYDEQVRLGEIQPAPGSGHIYENLTIINAWLGA